MSDPTLRELLKPRTAAEVKADLVARLATKPEVPVTDWNTGASYRTLIEVEAETQADLYEAIPQLAAGGNLDDAAGDWLTLYARSQYRLERNPATFTVDTVRLTCAVDAGPHVIQPGDHWFQSDTGKLYFNTTGGTLTAGGTLDLSVKAESAGATYNVARNTITRMLTPLSGVTATNPEGGLVTAGTEAESDESLKARCAARWATLAPDGKPAAAYEFWAREAHTSVTQVRVLDDHPRGQGTIDVVVYGPSGLGSEALDAVEAYIAARKSLVADVLTYEATPLVVALTGTIKVKAGYLAQAQADAAENLAALERSVLIGGKTYKTAMQAAYINAAGVISAPLTAPATEEIQLDTAEVLVIDATGVLWQEV